MRVTIMNQDILKGRGGGMTHPILALFSAVLLAGCQLAGDSTSANEKAASKGTPAGGGGSGILHALGLEPVTIAEGTTLPLVLDTALSSATSRTGDLVMARLAEDVRVGEKVVVPAGPEVLGQVTAAVPSGRVKGLARLAFDFDTLVFKGKKHAIGTKPVDITAGTGHKRDAEIIGGGAGAGAIIGAIANGGKGAAIGAIIGGATGTGVVLTNKGKEVELGTGTLYTVRLTREARL
jgi:hypothetical protein